MNYDGQLWFELSIKKMPEFWKSWNAKFRKNISKRVIINGFTSDIDIANEFAMHFKQVFVRSVDDDVAYIIMYENARNV